MPEKPAPCPRCGAEQSPLLQCRGSLLCAVEGNIQSGSETDAWKVEKLLIRVREQLTAAVHAAEDPVFLSGVCAAGPSIALRGVDVEPESLPTELRRLATYASCGKGEETVTDLGVRRVLKVPVADVSVTWPRLAEVVAEVEAAATPGRRLVADLHDVLLYEEGSFFKPHKDSRKREGHVLTLSVTAAVGGGCGAGDASVAFWQRELESEGRTWWDCAGAGRWAAWFCSEPHEVEPVRKGWRVAVTYNLCLTGETHPVPQPEWGTIQRAQHVSTLARISPDCLEAAAEYLPWRDAVSAGTACRLLFEAALGSPVKKLTAFLRDRAACYTRLAQLAGAQTLGYLLQHQYSTDGAPSPPMSSLRGRDAILCEAMRRAYGVVPRLRVAYVLFERAADSTYGATAPPDEPDPLRALTLGPSVDRPTSTNLLALASVSGDSSSPDDEPDDEPDPNAVQLRSVPRPTSPAREEASGVLNVRVAEDILPQRCPWRHSPQHRFSGYWPRTELDTFPEFTPLPFLGVLWGTSPRALNSYAAEMDFCGRTERLWGNQAAFSIYNYRDVCILADLPFASDAGEAGNTFGLKDPVPADGSFHATQLRRPSPLMYAADVAVHRW